MSASAQTRTSASRRILRPRSRAEEVRRHRGGRAPDRRRRFLGRLHAVEGIGDNPDALSALADLEALHYDALACLRPGMPASELFGMVQRAAVRGGLRAARPPRQYRPFALGGRRLHARLYRRRATTARCGAPGRSSLSPNAAISPSRSRTSSGSAASAARSSDVAQASAEACLGGTDSPVRRDAGARLDHAYRRARGIRRHPRPVRLRQEHDLQHRRRRARADAGSMLHRRPRRHRPTGHVGYMLQKDLLLPWRTVLDNIVLGAVAERRRRRARARGGARRCSSATGWASFVNHYPARALRRHAPARRADAHARLAPRRDAARRALRRARLADAAAHAAMAARGLGRAERRRSSSSRTTSTRRSSSPTAWSS